MEKQYECRRKTNQRIQVIKSITFQKGEVIFRQGAFELWMCDILDGDLSDYGAPDEKLLTMLEPGLPFGEMGMIESRPRSALHDTVETEGDERIKLTFRESTGIKAVTKHILTGISDPGRTIRKMTGICRRRD